jgi:excisionase family DNA binding protein
MFESHEGSGPSKTPASYSNNGSVPRRFLSKRELAAVLGVSTRTIENWLTAKKIPQIRLSARLIRFSLPKVEAALARYEVREVGRRP